MVVIILQYINVLSLNLHNIICHLYLNKAGGRGMGTSKDHCSTPAPSMPNKVTIKNYPLGLIQPHLLPHSHCLPSVCSHYLRHEIVSCLSAFVDTVSSAWNVNIHSPTSLLFKLYSSFRSALNPCPDRLAQIEMTTFSFLILTKTQSIFLMWPT